MTIQSQQPITRSDTDILVNNPRISANYNINVTLDTTATATVLGVGYPIGFNGTTGKHSKWTAPDATVIVVSLVSASSGTWTVTVNGITTAGIAYAATAADVVEAIRLIGYDVTVVLDTAVYTITFDAQTEIDTLPTVTGTVTGITGGTPTAVATAGTSTYGTNNIVGFVNPNSTQIGVNTASITLSGSATTATATTATPHGLTTGMLITVTGASDTDYNVTTTAVTVLTPTTFEYTADGTVAASDTGSYTTTNETMTTIMNDGVIHAALPESLVATGDVTALRTALKDGLVAKGLIVQGLAGRY